MSTISSSLAFARESDAHLVSEIPPRPMAGDADLDCPAEIFHELTKYHRATLLGQRTRIIKFLTDPHFIARGTAGFNEFPFREALDLPAPPPLAAGLQDALAKRSSCREFSPRLGLEQVSSLFNYALRPNRKGSSPFAPKVRFDFRPYPSPGNLNGLEAYAFFNSVDAVEPCTAHYDCRNHRFRILQKHAGEAFARAEISDGGKSIPAPLVVVLTMVPQRQTAKYGERGYRFALLEAGHAAQNLCLVAQGLGLGSLVYGSFYDDELATELGIDGVTETVATVVLIGPRKNQAST